MAHMRLTAMSSAASSAATWDATDRTAGDEGSKKRHATAPVRLSATANIKNAVVEEVAIWTIGLTNQVFNCYTEELWT